MFDINMHCMVYKSWNSIPAASEAVVEIGFSVHSTDGSVRPATAPA